MPPVRRLRRLRLRGGGAGGDCIKIGLQGKSILRDYFQENRTSRRPFLLLRICFPGRPIFIQFFPGPHVVGGRGVGVVVCEALDPEELGRLQEGLQALLVDAHLRMRLILVM